MPRGRLAVSKIIKVRDDFCTCLAKQLSDRKMGNRNMGGKENTGKEDGRNADIQ
jgi:hypothetical protein